MPPIPAGDPISMHIVPGDLFQTPSNLVISDARFRPHAQLKILALSQLYTVQNWSDIEACDTSNLLTSAQLHAFERLYPQLQPLLTAQCKLLYYLVPPGDAAMVQERMRIEIHTVRATVEKVEEALTECVNSLNATFDVVAGNCQTLRRRLSTLHKTAAVLDSSDGGPPSLLLQQAEQFVGTNPGHADIDTVHMRSPTDTAIKRSRDEASVDDDLPRYPRARSNAARGKMLFGETLTNEQGAEYPHPVSARSQSLTADESSERTQCTAHGADGSSDHARPIELGQESGSGGDTSTTVSPDGRSFQNDLGSTSRRVSAESHDDNEEDGQKESPALWGQPPDAAGTHALSQLKDVFRLRTESGQPSAEGKQGNSEEKANPAVDRTETSSDDKVPDDNSGVRLGGTTAVVVPTAETDSTDAAKNSDNDGGEQTNEDFYDVLSIAKWPERPRKVPKLRKVSKPFDLRKLPRYAAPADPNWAPFPPSKSGSTIVKAPSGSTSPTKEVSDSTKGHEGEQ